MKPFLCCDFGFDYPRKADLPSSRIFPAYALSASVDLTCSYSLKLTSKIVFLKNAELFHFLREFRKDFQVGGF